jgi:hypothetical protein
MEIALPVSLVLKLANIVGWAEMEKNTFNNSGTLVAGYGKWTSMAASYLLFTGSSNVMEQLGYRFKRTLW